MYVVAAKRRKIKKINTIKISLSNDSMAQYALFMFLCSDVIKSILGVFISNVTLCTYITIAVIYFPVAIMTIRGGFKAKDFIILWLTIVLAFGISYLLYPQNAYYFTRKTYGVTYRILRLDRAIYGYLFIRLVNDKKEIFNTLKAASYVLMVYYVLTLISALRLGYWEEYNSKEQIVRLSYSLVFGYNVILPTLVFVYLAIKNRKIIYYFFSAVGVFCILAGGSRGALICLAAFIFFFTIKNWKLWSRSYLFLLVSLLAISFCAFFAFGGSAVIIEMLESAGIESRTLNALLEGTILDDHGRNTIWAMAIDMIKNSGFWGYGLYGDRPVISAYHYAGYCHNIFLEILVNFGVPIGLFLIIIIIAASLKMLLFCQDEEWRNLFLIFFACSCELFLSMSFWYVNYFWMAFAIIVCQRKEEGKKRTIKKV